jgi:glycogen debranching enzyme
MRAGENAGHSKAVDQWRRNVLKIATTNEDFYHCYNQGILDMAALRLPLKGTSRTVFVPAAGLPWFVALFGRDTFFASLQTLAVFPGFAVSTLEVLGQYQATKRDDYRDAEPGKILHAASQG